MFWAQSLTTPSLHTATVPCLNVTLTAPFSLHFVFVFLTRHLTTSSKEASLFNLNTLRQSEGNRPHRPSAAWQVSTSQGKRWRLKCPPSCCHDNSLAGSGGCGEGRACSQHYIFYHRPLWTWLLLKILPVPYGRDEKEVLFVESLLCASTILGTPKDSQALCPGSFY